MTKTFATGPATEPWEAGSSGQDRGTGGTGRPGAGPPDRPHRSRWASALLAPLRWWPLPLGVLLGLSGGAAYGLQATPQYTATGYVVVVPYDGTDPMTALGFAQAYGRVTDDGAVMARAAKRVGVPVPRLRDSVQVATSPDAPMVEITGTHTRPARAAAIANAVATALTRSGNGATEDTGVRLTLFSRATVPTEPTSPSPEISAAVGACAGGLVGALALLAAPRGRREPAPTEAPASAEAPSTASAASSASSAETGAFAVRGEAPDRESFLGTAADTRRYGR